MALTSKVIAIFINLLVGGKVKVLSVASASARHLVNRSFNS
jgi:hypothetical protein